MVFSKDYCPFCKQAKMLLDEKGVEYQVIEMNLIQDGQNMHDVLKIMTSQNTVPCTFINGEKIGGCDDLMVAESNGKLDEMLAA